MKTYYAVCNVGGPISHAIVAATVEDAIASFEDAETREWIDNADCDAEDDLDIEDADTMTEDEFDSALEAAGYTCVRDLSVVDNYHSGKSSHLLNGWMLYGEC